MKPKDTVIGNVLKKQAVLQSVVDTILKAPSWTAFEQIRVEIEGMPMSQLRQELDQMQRL